MRRIHSTFSSGGRPHSGVYLVWESVRPLRTRRCVCTPLYSVDEIIESCVFSATPLSVDIEVMRLFLFFISVCLQMGGGG